MGMSTTPADRPKYKFNWRWPLCLIGIHDWEYDTMSLEAYAQCFAYCKRCGVMNYRKEFQR